MSDEQNEVQTEKPRYLDSDKFTDNLAVGDEMLVAGTHVAIAKIETNKKDELVLHLDITGALTKKRSTMMLIIPKKIAVTFLLKV